MNTLTDQQIEERQPSQSPPEYHPRWVFSFWSSLLRFTDPSSPSPEGLTLLEVLRLADSPPSLGPRPTSLTLSQREGAAW